MSLTLMIVGPVFLVAGVVLLTVALRLYRGRRERLRTWPRETGWVVGYLYSAGGYRRVTRWQDEQERVHEHIASVATSWNPGGPDFEPYPIEVVVDPDDRGRFEPVTNGVPISVYLLGGFGVGAVAGGLTLLIVGLVTR